MNPTSRTVRRTERAEARLRAHAGSVVRLCAAAATETAAIHAEVRDRSVGGCALLVPGSARLSLGGAVTLEPPLGPEAASGVGAGRYRVVRIAPGPRGSVVVGCRRLVADRPPVPVGQRHWVRGAQATSAARGPGAFRAAVGIRSGDGASFGV